MVPLMLIFLVLLPILLVFSAKVTLHMKHSARDRGMRASRHLANNMVIDYMRQFSGDYRGEHYADLWIQRNWDGSVGYEGGRSSATYNARLHASLTPGFVEDRRMLALRVSGEFKNRAADSQRLYGIVSFHSDVLRYGLVSHDDLTVNSGDPLDGRTVNGGVWIGGDVNFDPGATLVLGNGGGAGYFGSTGVLVATGSVFGTGLRVPLGMSMHYGGGTGSVDPSSQGSVVNYIPWNAADIQPRLEDLGYYLTHSATSVVCNPGAGIVSATFSFLNNGVRIDRDGLGGSEVLTFNVPAVLVTNGCNLWVQEAAFSRVSRRITVVAVQGNVFVNGDIRYSGGGGASASRSLAVISGGDLTFLAGGPFPADVSGLFFSAGTVVLDRDVNLRGTLVTQTGEINNTGGARLDITFDPDLRRFSPPGLPERPRLVRWQPAGN
jgi:hypothetical protein